MPVSVFAPIACPASANVSAMMGLVKSCKQLIFIHVCLYFGVLTNPGKPTNRNKKEYKGKGNSVENVFFTSPLRKETIIDFYFFSLVPLTGYTNSPQSLVGAGCGLRDVGMK